MRAELRPNLCDLRGFVEELGWYSGGGLASEAGVNPAVIIGWCVDPVQLAQSRFSSMSLLGIICVASLQKLNIPFSDTQGT